MIIDQKFKIGNIVKNTTTGVDNTYTTVVAVEYGAYYKLKLRMAGYLNKAWDEKFPGWEERCVYTCKPPFPTRNISYLEYCTARGIPSTEGGRREYEENVKEYGYIQYTEEDLELYLEDAEDITDRHLEEMGYKE